METKSKRVKFPISEDAVMMGRVSNGMYYDNIYMMKLDAKNEENLNKKDFIVYGERIIDSKDCIISGNLDFNNPDEIEEFKMNNFVWSDITPGSFVPFNFNYDTLEADAICTECGKWIIRTVETFDPLVMFKTAFALLGKPKKIIVFKIKSRKRTSDLC